MNGDESRHEETPAVVTAADELVLESAEAAEQLRELLQSGRRQIVLDLRRTAYVSGVGLGLVAEAAKQARRGGGDVKLVVRRPQVRHVFEVGDLGALLEFYDDVESACEAFAECIGEVERTLLWRPVSDE